MTTTGHRISKELMEQLIKRCTMSVSDYVQEFISLGADIKHTPDGPVMHLDRGSPVIGVAHMDHVKFWEKPVIVKEKKQIWCPQLDDRLGVWVLLDLLPSFGVHTDILLTDSEECGRSTAKDFKTDKQFNWMYQFDRRGTDTVLYDYDSDENRARLEAHELTTSWGSFSDICSLEHLGCSGWNVGTGYYSEHSDKCHANLRETYFQALKFANFFAAHKDTHIPIPAQPKRRWGGYTYTGWDDAYTSRYDDVLKRVAGAVDEAESRSKWRCEVCHDMNMPEWDQCHTCWESRSSSKPSSILDDWCCAGCYDLNNYDNSYCHGCHMTYDDSEKLWDQQQKQQEGGSDESE